VLNDFESGAASGKRLLVLKRILQTLLEREQSKVAPLAEQLGLEPSRAFSPHEQLDWLASELLGAPVPALSWCPEEKRAEYVEQVARFLHDHPFREGQGWASPVFSSFAAAERFSRASPDLLRQAAGATGLFFEFTASNSIGLEVIVDEFQFAALHASLMSGEWATSTSMVNIRSVTPAGPNEPTDSTTARLTLLQKDEGKVTLDVVIVLAEADRLVLQSPLSNIDVYFAGGITITSSTTSVDLGPDAMPRSLS